MTYSDILNGDLGSSVRTKLNIFGHDIDSIGGSISSINSDITNIGGSLAFLYGYDDLISGSISSINSNIGGIEEDILAIATTIDGFGTMALQDYDSVAITGGSANFGDSSNYTRFDLTGHQTMVGNAKPWNDIRIEPTARNTGTNAPTFEKYLDSGSSSRGVYLYSFDDVAANSEKEIFFTMQMPHDWDNSNIHVHAHWIGATTQVTASKIRWGLEYSWSSVNYVFGNTETLYADTVEGGDTTVTAFKHYLTEFADIAPSGSQNSLSSILVGRLFRNSSNIADTYTGKAGLLYLDAHYQMNSIGSDQEYIK
jgi:hypothetical protein